MRNSLLAAMLITFGAAVTVPTIAAEKIEPPAAARDQSIQHQQMQKDAGKDVTTGSTGSQTSGKDRPDQK